jgi:hypothetical protein
MELSMRSGQGKGWLLIGLVGVLISFSSSAWALDLDSEIQRQEQAAAELMPTLGHDLKVKTPENTAADSLKVQLIKPTVKRARSS